MVDVGGIADTDIESQRIELGQRPDGVEIYLRPNDYVLLFIYFGVIDVVVIFHANACADSESDGPE